MRLRVDALVYSADAISSNWRRLRAGAIDIGSDVSRINNLLRADMLSAAWSIVDELDAVRLLVAGMVEPDSDLGPNTKALLSACGPVKKFRDKLRHLSSNLSNEAAKKGSRSPLFGALSWIWCPEYQSGKAHVMLLQSGSLRGNESMSVLNPAGKTFVPPADLFQINAFDDVLELGGPILAFARWIDANSKIWFDDIDSQIKQHASEAGIEESKLWEHGPSGVSAAVAIEFGGVGIKPIPSSAK